MGFSLNVSVPALTVFAQGLLSFFSPCVLPLLPLYLSYLSGGAETAEDGSLRYPRGRAMVNTVFFVLGISAAFFLLGLGMTAVGRFFGARQLLFARIGGVIVLLFGLYQLGVFGDVAWLSRERRLPVSAEKLSASPLAALLMGFLFSFSWTPCVGPTLSSVLLMAASAASGAAGFMLIGVYTLGFVIPFLAVGAFTTTMLDLFRRYRSVVRWTGKIGGALMILMGVLMITGAMNQLSGYFSRLSEAETAEKTPSAAEETVREKKDALSDSIGPPSETAEATPAPTPAPEEEEVFPAYDFTLYDQYGAQHSLEDYRGKVIFLNFWATWCPPCRAEMPDIEALYEQYESDPDSDVVILGVAFPGMGSETDVSGVTEFLEENGYFYPVLMDMEAELAAPYYISAFPTTYMIDTEGNIYGYVTGSISRDIMEEIIRQTREASGLS